MSRGFLARIGDEAVRQAKKEMKEAGADARDIESDRLSIGSKKGCTQ